MRTARFSSFALAVPVAIAALAQPASAQESPPPIDISDQVDAALGSISQAVDQGGAAESGESAASSTPQVTATWRFIARWAVTARSQIRSRITLDRGARISRRSSDPRAQGWRVSLPDFSRDRVVAPPQAAAVAKANGAASESASAIAKGTADATTTADVPTRSDD